ncbi:hypothetical protein ACOTDF_19310 [Achromobacter insuavis]|uniref:hypothetical protein n=1 Tax=Achromobacter insuavis TaxID=1287735 RepID=UPI003B9BE7FF
MQLDTRIPLMAQVPQFESLQNLLAKSLQIKQMEQRVQDNDRSMQQRNALAGVLGGAFDDNGRLQAGALGRIAQTAPDYAPQFAQLANTQQRLDSRDALTNAQLGQRRLQWLQNAVGAAKDYNSAVAQIQLGVDSGAITPKEAQTWLPQIPQDQTKFDEFIGGINRQMMTAAQRADLEKGNYSAPAQSSQGFFQADRSGNVRVLKGPDGKPLMPVTLDATGQAAVAGAKTTATKEAEKAVAKPGQAIEAKAALDSTVGSLDRLRERALAIKNNPALGSVTGVSGMFPNFPGGDAADVQGDLDNLRSQVGFSVLQAMRDASKTGGALGAISDKENELLQNNLAPLMKKQSKEKTQQSLQEIIDYVDAAKGRLSSTYQQQYGNVTPQANPAGGSSTSGGRPSLTDIFGN